MYLKVCTAPHTFQHLSLPSKYFQILLQKHSYLSSFPKEIIAVLDLYYQNVTDLQIYLEQFQLSHVDFLQSKAQPFTVTTVKRGKGALKKVIGI